MVDKLTFNINGIIDLLTVRLLGLMGSMDRLFCKWSKGVVFRFVYFTLDTAFKVKLLYIVMALLALPENCRYLETDLKTINLFKFYF